MKKKAAQSTKQSVLQQQYSEEVKSFIVHKILYVLINVGLFIYFYSNNQNLNVFFWVLGGWGVGLLAHALAVFGVMKFLHKEW